MPKSIAITVLFILLALSNLSSQKSIRVIYREYSFEQQLASNNSNLSKSLSFSKHITYTILNTLYNSEKENAIMECKTAPFKIFNKGNLKIGILEVGILLKGLATENIHDKNIYHYYSEHANTNGAILYKEGCNMTICLSHLGDKYPNDKILNHFFTKESFDIDLIIDGLDKHFFEIAREYSNKCGCLAIINQTGCAGIQLGRLNHPFLRTKKKNLLEAHTVVIGKNTS